MNKTAWRSKEASMNCTLPPDEEKLVASVSSLARERFAPRAAAYDAENIFPTENYADLREHGLMSLTVPKEYGGKGLSSLGYCLAMREMARGDASTALTFNMHATIMTLIDHFGTPEQKARYYGSVVKHGAIFASIGSEPAASPNSSKFYVETTLSKAPGGYLMNGNKYFCSFGNAADYYFVYVMLDGAKRIRDGLVSAVVPKGTPGTTVIETWNSMAMRATASHSMTFKEVFVREDDIVGPPGVVFTSGLGAEYAVGYAAIYLGIAEAAYEFARDYARTRVIKPDTQPIGHSPVIQRHIAEMSVALEAARLMSAQAALMSHPGTPERVLAISQAKYLSAETAIKVTDLALRVCGGRGLLKDYPLERYYRDVRAGLVMGPSTDFLLLNIGRAELGLNMPLRGQGED
jgi:alkylation response protein AidB-like acyl-CoA dehydrogenase